MQKLPEMFHVINTVRKDWDPFCPQPNLFIHSQSYFTGYGDAVIKQTKILALVDLMLQ